MKKKKIYLKDIKDNRELLEYIFKHNQKLQEACYENTYEDFMEQQLEFGELCLGKGYFQYIEIRDNYSSFYLRLLDGAKMIENIDKDYLTTEEQDLYNEAYKILVDRNNTEYGTDYFYELDIELDKKAEELLKMIENDLHAYENVSEEDAIENFIFNLKENNVYEDLYYYETWKGQTYIKSDYDLYEDISYTKDWN